MANYVSLLVLALILMTFAAPPVWSTTASENYPGTYPQEIYIKAEGDDGSPLPNAKVYLYMMTENGWKLIGTRYSNSAGVASFIPGLPADLKRIVQTERGAEYVYSSVNLMAVVEKDSYIGLYTFAVDPGKDSNTQKMVSVVAHSIPKSSSASEQLIRNYPPSPDYTLVLDERYQYTPVLRFSTNYNISAQYQYPAGCKIRVQTKYRSPYTPSGYWYDGGYVEITVDSPIWSSWFNGSPQIIELQFEIKYQHSYVIGRDIYMEVITAVDTSDDPRSYNRVQYSWDGQPVSGVVYRDVLQNDFRGINVTGGSTYIFSVGVNFPDVSISLGVTKAPAPEAILIIGAGSWYPGYKARIVSLGDSSYLDTRVFWVSSS